MEYLTAYVVILFVLTTAITLLILYKATGKSRIVLTGSLAWLAIQGAIGYSGFYQDTMSLPPRLILLILPPMILILFLGLTRKGKTLIEQTDAKYLSLLHVVRVPVELCLFGLFLKGEVPELMTFEGRNFDILSGISAIFVYYYGFVKPRLGRQILLGWNLMCLCLLANIVIHAILSVPTPFQQLAFEQPNIGVLHFPFVWLPCFIVPAVLFSHIASIRHLLLKMTNVRAELQQS